MARVAVNGPSPLANPPFCGSFDLPVSPLVAFYRRCRKSFRNWTSSVAIAFLVEETSLLVLYFVDYAIADVRWRCPS